jgi:hypothetical protein
VPPNDPRFYERYENVGQFPGVEGSAKKIQTDFTTTMLGFATPLYRFLEGVVYLKLDMNQAYKATLNSFNERGREQTAPQKVAIWRNRGLYLEATAHLLRRRYDEARSLLKAIIRSTDRC